MTATMRKTQKKREEDTSCCPVGLVSRTGLLIHTLADFIELRLSWAKDDLQLLGVLSSAVKKIHKKYDVKSDAENPLLK